METTIQPPYRASMPFMGLMRAGLTVIALLVAAFTGTIVVLAMLVYLPIAYIISLMSGEANAQPRSGWQRVPA